MVATKKAHKAEIEMDFEQMRTKDPSEKKAIRKKEMTMVLEGEWNRATRRFLAESEFGLCSSGGVNQHLSVFSDSGKDVGGFSGRENLEIIGNSNSPFAFVVGEERAGLGFFYRNFQSNTARNVLWVKEILRRIDHEYEKIFKGPFTADEEDFFEKQFFFNSNLLYLIATACEGEDTLWHSQLVANYSMMLTKALGIEDKNFLVNIQRGALLHDIGKIGIPESILGKAGPLTKREREIVKEHPVLGYEMIQEFDFLKRAALVVLFHHENYDGSGYPYGLVGEEIPLEARIFFLADTLDAMTSDRPYSEGKSFEEACREIEKAEGSQFDPLLVDVFLSIPIEKWQSIKARTQISLSFATIH